MRRNLGVAAAAGLAAAFAGHAHAEQINVSKIASGTHVNVDWTELNQASVAGASYSFFTLATAQAAPDARPFFAPGGWTSATSPAPAKPSITRTTKLADYTQGNAPFAYDRHYTSNGVSSMTPASPATKPVSASMFKSGSAAGQVSYRVRIDATSAQALDYFLELQIPQPKLGVGPGYDLCCSGDSNGGTYSYHRPKSASSRAAIDLYADELPIWTSETAFLYPNVGPNGSPFDKLQIAWDKPTPAGKTTLYLGRLAAPASVTITFAVRTEAHGDGDCGVQNYGFGGNPSYAVHCLSVDQSVALSGGDAAGAPVGFILFAKTPK
jgi:hypothetical protein